MKKTTIRDIAREAGVSPATVSLALNEKGNLPEERRKAIRALAKQMGYQPNAMARALRGASTDCVGVVINYFNNPFFRSMFAGLESRADEYGVSFTVSQSRDQLERERRNVRLMAERGVDGLIVLPCGDNHTHLQEIATSHNIPIVLISHTLEGSFAAIEADNSRGARLVAEHFLELGKRANIHLAGPQEKSGIRLRNEAFSAVMLQRDPSFSLEDNVFYTKNLTAEGGYMLMDSILQKHTPPCSIFAVNDEVALGVMHYCRQHNLAVPKDVAVAGFSDIDILEAYGIPLTTVHIPARRMGENAMELILDLKKNARVKEFPPVITLPVNLVVRGSTEFSKR